MIGVIDSGVGGLTVLRALREALPGERFIYAGDTARAPYGDLSPDMLIACGREIVGFLLCRGVKAIVLGCGSLSSTAYDTLCKEFPEVPIIDVLRPGVAAVRAFIKKSTDSILPPCKSAAMFPPLCKSAVMLSPPCDGAVVSSPPRVGIIATAATVNSGFFVRLLRAECPGISVEARACPLFAPMVERGIFTGEDVRQAAAQYLDGWQGSIDVLVLACTHYPLLITVLRDVLPGVPIIDLAASAAAAAERLLAPGRDASVTTPPTTAASIEYYVSGAPETFNSIAGFIMGEACFASRVKFLR